MSDLLVLPHPHSCAEGVHEWVDNERGHTCRLCGEFCAYGDEPWILRVDGILVEGDELTEEQLDEAIDQIVELLRKAAGG